MKRSGFKKKTLAEIKEKQAEKLKVVHIVKIDKKTAKKGQILRNKTLSISITSLKKKLWNIVSKRIKERDNYICFTSGKKVEGVNAHCGHGKPMGACGGRLKYHPKNLHCQSYHENINLGGNGREYYKRQVMKYGQDVIDELDKLDNKFMKVDKFFYETLIELYTSGTWEDIENFLES